MAEYVVNATSAEHVAAAMKWAVGRDMRIAVKGTGHEMNGTNATAGTYVTIGLQGGPGVQAVSEERWGVVSTVWRDVYLHVIATGADMDATAPGGPKKALSDAAEWLEEHKEKMWREWAPDMGARYGRHGFYGSTYDKLVEVKKKYDPSKGL
ncbi:hypothetical protein SLS58_010034 [Diplodia intermedia]|uniref:Uncharacterized protein n=1 Tax=Diplodia intermedia TaxID=856260 RepID=A0ABR3T8Q5_9PEZI